MATRTLSFDLTSSTLRPAASLSCNLILPYCIFKSESTDQKQCFPGNTTFEVVAFTSFKTSISCQIHVYLYFFHNSRYLLILLISRCKGQLLYLSVLQCCMIEFHFLSCWQLMRPFWSLTTPMLSWSTPEASTEKNRRLCGEGGSKKRGRLCRENESEKVMTAKDKQLDLSDIVRIRNWLAPRSIQRAKVFFRITEWCIMKRCKNHLFV